MHLLALFVASWFAGPARAAEPAFLYVREGLGGGAFPTGVQSRTLAQLRAPFLRGEGPVSRMTFAGAGLRATVAPVFAEVGPVVSASPVDVLVLDAGASWTGYYSWGGNGLLPFDEPSGKLQDQRHAKADQEFSTSLLQAWVAPTLQLKVGPVLAFDSWTISALRFAAPPEATAPHVYEPGRDLVVDWSDLLTEHQAAVLVEVLSGGDRPLLRLGPTYRGRAAYGSGDRSDVAGGLVSLQPGSAASVPTVIVLAMAYLRDADRVGSAPNVQAQLSWELRRPLR